MEEAFLTKCVVDPIKRSFYLYSSEGEKRVVNCDNTDEFMNVLDNKCFNEAIVQSAHHCGKPPSNRVANQLIMKTRCHECIRQVFSDPMK